MLLPCQDVVLSLQRLSCSTRAVLVSLSLSLTWIAAQTTGHGQAAALLACSLGVFGSLSILL
jgi:hypothetical protein